MWNADAFGIPNSSTRFDSLRDCRLSYIFKFINEHRECVCCALSRFITHTLAVFLIDNQSLILLYYGVYGRLWLNRHFPLPHRNTHKCEATVCIHFWSIHSFNYSNVTSYAPIGVRMCQLRKMKRSRHNTSTISWSQIASITDDRNEDSHNLNGMQ